MVSVIMPAYNCRATLKEAVDSVLRQEVPLELIVIDDGSADPADDIMEAYADDSRVRYLKNQNNIGVSATRNRGVREAKGEWIAFLDADDYWGDGKLVSQLKCLERTGGILSCTARELMTVDGTLTGRIIPVKKVLTYQDLLSQNWINNSSVVVKREVLLEFPMEADEVHEDYLLWLKVMKKYRKAYGINEPFLKYRVDPHSKSGNKLHSAVMTYRTYVRAGLSHPHAMICFLRYAVNGIKKYYV